MKQIVSFLLILWGFNLFAQKLDLRNREIFFSLGTVENRFEKFVPTENLDFMNYFDTTPDDFDYVIVNFGYGFDFLTAMSAKIKLTVMSDLEPGDFDLITFYHYNKWATIGLGTRLNKLYVTNFEQYQLLSLPDYYLGDENIQQLKVSDLGFYLSPTLRLVQSDWFQAKIRLDIGVSTFLKEEAVFYHKRKLSNERVMYHYQTKINFQPYANPGVEVRLRAFNIKKTSIGFLVNSNYLYNFRSVNYKRTIQRWTSDNEVVESVKSPKHKYTRFETEFGLYIKW